MFFKRKRKRIQRFDLDEDSNIEMVIDRENETPEDRVRFYTIDWNRTGQAALKCIRYTTKYSAKGVKIVGGATIRLGKQMFKVGYLVMKYFFNRFAEKGQVLHHKDGNGQNCSPDNITYIDRAELSRKVMKKINEDRNK